MDDAAPRGARFRVGDRVRSHVSFAGVRVEVTTALGYEFSIGSEDYDPIVAEQPPPAAEDTKRPPMQNGVPFMADAAGTPSQPRTTVLITDDEAQVCMIGARMIAHLGFAVLTAIDGPTAIALVQAHDAELGCVLLDINMPHMDGITAAVLIHQIAPQLPIVLMSAGGAPPRIQTAGLSLAGFLQKPFTLHDLQALLTPIIPTAAP